MTQLTDREYKMLRLVFIFARGIYESHPSWHDEYPTFADFAKRTIIDVVISEEETKELVTQFISDSGKDQYNV